MTTNAMHICTARQISQSINDYLLNSPITFSYRLYFQLSCTSKIYTTPTRWQHKTQNKFICWLDLMALSILRGLHHAFRVTVYQSCNIISRVYDISISQVIKEFIGCCGIDKKYHCILLMALSKQIRLHKCVICHFF